MQRRVLYFLFGRSVSIVDSSIFFLVGVIPISFLISYNYVFLNIVCDSINLIVMFTSIALMIG